METNNVIDRILYIVSQFIFAALGIALIYTLNSSYSIITPSLSTTNPILLLIRSIIPYLALGFSLIYFGWFFHNEKHASELPVKKYFTWHGIKHDFKWFLSGIILGIAARSLPLVFSRVLFALGI
jgi:hypothetical protein